ncbi:MULTISPECIES: ureidoglycolate lyase [Gammaproteobacteria]|uniref:ureidoglycolate lyase n=1 Tax=Gammaproteobacteria TaxID=1236 RepID=UPI001ADA1F7D|nr:MULTISPECIES: ureidoglycolate lyase [Gammaproteobacteria]MBO9480663.1 ureidoglycolate lyase [Salinisphaera sp. G21_0]MBO9494063.1 ureidoglycolate lyase [Thalassotalea sp. G20_0]
MDKEIPAQTLKVEILTREAFEPFGDVLETRDVPLVINQGRCQKYSDLTSVTTDDQGYTTIHIYKTAPINHDYQLDLLERHPLGSQTFMPLAGQRFLVVVAPDSSDGSTPEWSSIRCFLTNGKQGVTYHPGVWHHPLLSIAGGDDGGEEYLVIDRKGPGDNCDEVLMSVPYIVEVP